MAANLIEIFHNTVGEAMVKESSGILGETADSISSAIQAIVPVLLASVAEKGLTDESASGLLRYMDENSIDGSILTNAASLLGGNIETEKLMYSGAVLLRYLLNDKISPVVDLIAGSSGLKTSSATSIVKMTAPFLMGILGKQIQEKGLDAPGLKNLLEEQKPFIKSSLPKGFETALGLDTKWQTKTQPSARGKESSAGSMDNSSFSKFLPWIVLMITALGLFYFVQKGCGSSVEAEPSAAPPSADSTSSTKTEIENPFRTYSLPGGESIKALPGSFTGKMADFLAGTEKGDKCIAFDRVTFESGSFKIAAGSETQLNQLATILKAYPYLKIQIEGHTDEEGDDGKNKELSRERAKVIKTWLTDHDIVPGRIDVKGWGEEKPIASNETKSGRQKNRRIEVCLTKK